MTAKSSQAFYIGLDLAWGETARTGIAVLTDSGALLSSACLLTNDEIADFLSPLVGSHASVVAIDAPLVVPNETGQRECERQVAKLFGRYNAGAYPANRRNPLFAPEPRGARLATRFGWDLNPGSSSSAGHSVAIEVYPHPAMVALFGLSTVIPYKSKKVAILSPAAHPSICCSTTSNADAASSYNSTSASGGTRSAPSWGRQCSRRSSSASKTRSTRSSAHTWHGRGTPSEAA